MIVIPLSSPLSVRHPEWLLRLMEAAKKNGFFQTKLNQVLALDHWHNHPLLPEMKKSGRIEKTLLLNSRSHELTCSEIFG
jgi:hypothetical protein